MTIRLTPGRVATLLVLVLTAALVGTGHTPGGHRPRTHCEPTEHTAQREYSANAYDLSTDLVVTWQTETVCITEHWKEYGDPDIARDILDNWTP